MQKGMKRRLTSYIALIIILFLGHYLLRDIVWNADIYFHTIVEIISSFLALFVGVLALVHYYNKKSNVSLIIGSGFIGTGLLEAYHAIASLPLFIHLFPSQPAALINWSCVSPRLFLSLALCTNLIAEISEKKLGESGKINKNIIYAIALIFIILNFELTTLLKLPTGFYSGIIWAKPEEIIPGILFLLAFLGYLQKGDWQKGGFYHWLMLFLTVSFMVQFTYMAFSSQPFDIMFNIGHILKIISYLLIITGLFINVYWLFKQEKYQEEYISAILSSIVDCVITTNAKGVIETANPVVTDLFGYSTSELTGRTIDILIPKLVLGEKNMCFIKEDNVFVLPKIIDGNFELIGVRKEGGFFPLTLGINEIKFGNKSIFTLVIRDITQRKEVERIKDDFVSMVNHELRTPLTSIRGSLGLILSNAIGEVSSQIKEMIEVAYSNSNRLLTLINDILDNEKIAAGKMEFKLEPVELMSI
ncbi:MAG TPA: hypothetical protein DDX14_09650, partial [Cyanobacteria bacterium UBA9579]|nr:hypothetical protein [Cyanobacteria bacterium UBA9579]